MPRRDTTRTQWPSFKLAHQLLHELELWWGIHLWAEQGECYIWSRERRFRRQSQRIRIRCIETNKLRTPKCYMNWDVCRLLLNLHLKHRVVLPHAVAFSDSKRNVASRDDIIRRGKPWWVKLLFDRTFCLLERKQAQTSGFCQLSGSVCNGYIIANVKTPLGMNKSPRV